MIYGGFVYILTTKKNTVLYVGVTSDLGYRVKQHKERFYPTCFTARYNVDKLVFFKTFGRIEEAIAEEKRLKGGNRQQKIDLIQSMNPSWDDLYFTRLYKDRR